MNTNKYDTAYVGAGCFWCTEAVYQQLKGVVEVGPGYSGGAIPNPTYEQICKGNTGHAEAISIVYDPSLISYEDILDVFWHTHDPTSMNRQGADVGTQYRSVIFYTNEHEKQIAIKLKASLNATEFNNKIVTEITPFNVFYKAEKYHENYFNTHQDQPYCQYVINPKLEKFRHSYQSKIK